MPLEIYEIYAQGKPHLSVPPVHPDMPQQATAKTRRHAQLRPLSSYDLTAILSPDARHNGALSSCAQFALTKCAFRADEVTPLAVWVCVFHQAARILLHTHAQAMVRERMSKTSRQPEPSPPARTQIPLPHGPKQVSVDRQAAWRQRNLRLISQERSH